MSFEEEVQGETYGTHTETAVYPLVLYSKCRNIFLRLLAEADGNSLMIMRLGVGRVSSYLVIRQRTGFLFLGRLYP